MKSDVFFENFELLTDAPNGIQKMRELILQLAVLGRLVEQSPDDESAYSLIDKLTAEKGGKRNQLGSPKFTEILDLEFELPETWRLSRIEEFSLLVTDGEHKTPTRINQPEVPLVTAKNVRDGYLDLKNTDFVSNDTAYKCWKRCNPSHNDILMVCVGATTGRLCLIKNPISFVLVRSVSLIRVNEKYIYPEYVALALKSPILQSQIWKNVKQSAQPCLYLNKIQNLFIPIPPLSEQKRIVSKVDELIALCDKLESSSQKQQELQNKLNSAALYRMLSADSQEEFEQDWQRICSNFDLLYDNPINVEKLRQAILQLAIRGKLVEHNPEDEPASFLIERINGEKKQLVKKKNIKQIKVLPIKNEDLPFELPDKWEFVRMGDITEKLGAGSTPLGGRSVYRENGIKFIRSQNVWNNGLKLENIAFISFDIHERMNGTFVEQGDILLNITGASIGRSSIVPDNFDEGNVNQHVSIIRLIDKTIREYIHLCIISPYIQNLIMSEQVGISREGLSMNRLKEFLIPIPPLAEQKRIVEKVEHLMGLFDELESKLRSSRGDSEKLMDSVVKGLLEEAAA
jgi:type I restriction enzyme S subunit